MSAGLGVVLTVVGLAFGQAAQPTPPTPPTPAAVPATPEAKAAPGTVKLEFRGPLRDALKSIAEQGGINLVATGKLDENCEIYLNGVSGEQALSTIASSYHLKVRHKGSIWTLRPMTKDEVDDLDEDDSSSEADAEELPGDKADSSNEIVQKGPVTIEEGKRSNNVVVYAGDATINGTVDRDVVALGGDVNVGPHGEVRGDAIAIWGQVYKSKGSRVLGKTVSIGKKDSSRSDNADAKPARVESRAAGNISSFLRNFALLFGIGFLFLMFAPTRLKELENEIRRDPLKAGVTGMAALVASIPLSAMLVLTVIGILLLPVLWFFVLLGGVAGLLAVANEIGRRIPVLQGKKTQAIILALGSLVLLVIEKVPFLGMLTLIAIALMGLGASVRTRFGERPGGLPEPLGPPSLPR